MRAFLLSRGHTAEDAEAQVLTLTCANASFPIPLCPKDALQEDHHDDENEDNEGWSIIMIMLSYGHYMECGVLLFCRTMPKSNTHDQIKTCTYIK